MSLITCCPACGTMFRVVPDQLKISDGWVRCGHCAEVFDASAGLVQQPEAAAPLAGPQPQPQPSVLPPAQEAAAAPAGEPDSRPASEPVTEPSPEVVAQVMAAAAPTQPAPLAPMHREDPDPDSELEESELDQPFVFRRSDLAQVDDVPVSPPVIASVFAHSRPAPSGFDAGDDDDAAVEDVSFMRAARRSAFWRRPRVRALLLLAGLLLGALLAVQVAVHDRDRLAAAHPGLRPWLQALCEPAGCTVGPPRQIESVVIDSSSFNKLRTDTYRLNFTLKNAAAIPIAVPSMELTLTDTQDQPVLRRVLAPADIGASQGTLAAGTEWSGSVTLAVAANGQGGRIAGYRLLAFYP
jgi:predicted Zn finger-like uncharacterized protein